MESTYNLDEFTAFLSQHHKGEKQAKYFKVFDGFAKLLCALFEHKRSLNEKNGETYFDFLELWKCRTDDPFLPASMNQQKTSINVMLAELMDNSPEALERLLNVTSRPEPYIDSLNFMRQYVATNGGFDESLAQMQNLSYLYQSFVCGVFNLIFFSDCKKIVIDPLGSFTLKENKSGTKSILFHFGTR
tara:strand:+ start:2874 stop:3437 length:564 start_codon:yes stop_codon:yes gene_type:complete